MTRPAGRVRSFQNLTGRVGSGGVQNLTGRVGSGHDPWDPGHVAGQSTLTHEYFFPDPRVGPVDPTFQKLAAFCPKTSLVPIHLWYNIPTLKRRQIYIFMSTSIHTHYPL